MAVQTLIGITLTLAVGAAVVGASARRVTGLVTAVTETSLQITTKHKGTTTVSVDAKTGYVKWIVHQPRQQDNRANRRSVAAGSCVDVEFRASDSRIAKIVWINTDGAGTFYDPCKSLRK